MRLGLPHWSLVNTDAFLFSSIIERKNVAGILIDTELDIYNESKITAVFSFIFLPINFNYSYLNLLQSHNYYACENRMKIPVP